MRPAVVNRLKAAAGVASLVGTRVYERQGPYGGISRDATPEAFSDPDHELLDSLVVWLELRRASPEKGMGPETITAEQTIAVAALTAAPGFDGCRALLRAVKPVLHRPTPKLSPVADQVTWVDTRWSNDGPEVIEPELGVPMIVARFTAVIVENLTP